ncbi:MAG: cob(I)yrinic acid a,c-diamide adenosyltransferase [Candidatus Levyibacteriota bacterium]|nr:MAG: cob(I)yrinic acid a,c-diamide adenosyltransferase [Candidatus Levybacteria bacterium]
MVKIYTKTGDKGETSLYGGKRVSKADLRVEAYGTVDELNSAIGITIAQFSNKSQIINLKKELTQIQNDLFEIGSILASPSTIRYTLDARRLEKMIDEMTKELPELRNFILPGGGIVGSYLHLTRSIARRAERRIVVLSQKEQVDKSILMYFNRLSDLLFTMARFVNYKENKKEVIWTNK